MKLHDSLDHAVADVSADLPALAVASRNQGLSIRRRRRALAAVGSVAAATVLAVGAYALAPGLDGGADRGVATDLAAPVVRGPLSGETATATNRSLAAALAVTVDNVADGTVGRFQGAAHRHEGFASLLFQPTAGSGPAGEVMVNIQPIGIAGRPPYTCDEYLDEWAATCAVRQLPNGDILRTYSEDDDTEYGVGSQRLAVEVLSPGRRLRVVVNALNTNPWAEGETRRAPVLSTEQATQIATQPWWNRTTLPAEYVEAGELLQDFADANADES
ncbi:hypothetical protein GCM10023350_46190 [Nocardioides endophyticus]|uniref:Uncharacterized protein n=1 Tax=Nocardioides endophyticus TaxID=1353775 RepID=A0ABP8ZG87_9ACTN